MQVQTQNPREWPELNGGELGDLGDLRDLGIWGLGSHSPRSLFPQHPSVTPT